MFDYSVQEIKQNLCSKQFNEIFHLINSGSQDLANLAVQIRIALQFEQRYGKLNESILIYIIFI